MHILFLTDNFPPEVNAPASRTFEHAREWVKAGHRVTVITCAPNFPRGKVFDGYRNRLWQTESMEGIRVIRVWTYITANEGFLRRTLDYLSYMVAAVVAAPFVRGVDVVVGTSPQFFTACAAYVVSMYKRVPFVFELRDLWPESIRAVGAMRTQWLLDMLERIELFLYRRAARVVSVTHAFKRNLVARGIDADKIAVVTNGVDIARFHAMPRDNALATRLGLDGRFVAGYVGTHGLAHGLDTLLEAARILKQHPEGKDVILLMLGDGAEKRRLVERARCLGLDNVLFLDSVPKAEVANYWSLLDVSIIHLRRNELFTTVIPSKLFECMGMGIPVLHGVAGESARIVEEEGVGVVFEPENATQLAGELLRLKRDRGALAQYRARALAAAPRYDRAALAQAMLGVLLQAVRPGAIGTRLAPD
jgi:hypothetical protein